MKLFSIRNLAMTGALSVAGLGLVGMGAHAVFTQNTTSQQTIQAGSMNVTLHADGATTLYGTDNTANVILAPTNSDEGSSFAEVYHVTMTNNSNIPVSEVSFQLGATNDNSPASWTMQAGLWACLYAGSGAMNGNEGEIYFNSPLNTAINWGAGASKFLTLAKGATDDYTLVIYAGPSDNGCGPQYDGYVASPFNFNPSDPNSPTLPGQFNGWVPASPPTASYPFYTASSPWTPSFSNNPAAGSLLTGAQGGVVTPVLTVGYFGLVSSVHHAGAPPI